MSDKPLQKENTPQHCFVHEWNRPPQAFLLLTSMEEKIILFIRSSWLERMMGSRKTSKEFAKIENGGSETVNKKQKARLRSDSTGLIDVLAIVRLDLRIFTCYYSIFVHHVFQWWFHSSSFFFFSPVQPVTLALLVRRDWSAGKINPIDPLSIDLFWPDLINACTNDLFEPQSNDFVPQAYRTICPGRRDAKTIDSYLEELFVKHPFSYQNYSNLISWCYQRRQIFDD